MCEQVFLGAPVGECCSGPPHHSPSGVATVPSGRRRAFGISENAFTVFVAEVDTIFLAAEHGEKARNDRIVLG
jgi:hypothetical protein